jgi:fructose-bisphosphate aldolase class II
MHTDHAAKKLLPWIDGLLDAGEKYFKVHGKPLFSSHMLDLSEEPIWKRTSTSASVPRAHEQDGHDARNRTRRHRR